MSIKIPPVGSYLSRSREWAARRVVGLSVAAVVAAAFYVFTAADVPTIYKVVVATVVGAGAVGYPAADRLVKWLWSPSWVYLLTLQAEGGPLRLYRLTPAQFSAVEVMEGDLERYDGPNPLYVARSYSPEVGTARGTWRASVSDLELIRDREKIREVRGRLERMAQEGLAARIQASSAVRSIVDQITKEIVGALEGRTMYRGDEIARIWEKELGELEELESLELELEDLNGDREGAGDGPETARNEEEMQEVQ